MNRVVCMAVACIEILGIIVSPRSFAAASSSLMFYQLQTGATGAATQEFISLYNNSRDPVDVTGWCVTYSSASDFTQRQLGCIVAPEPNVKIMLPAQSSLLMASTEFVAEHRALVPDIIFSAGMSGTSGHVRLLNSAKEEIDRLGWGSAVNPETRSATAHASGKILQRAADSEGLLIDTDNNATDFIQTTLGVINPSSLYEEEMPIDLCPNIEDLQQEMPEGYLPDNAGNCKADVCLNLDGLQIDVPDGYTRKDGEICELIPLEGAILIINELLPNPASYDTGKEFIEIYNPNSRPINLDGYKLQVAPNFTKSYALPTGQTILPGGYQVFSDTDTGLVLLNSTALLRLLAPNGNVVSTTSAYNSPKENSAWALFGQTWQYTNRPTPGAANLVSLEDPEPAVEEEIISLASCPAGQYRNADTNRCRLLSVVTSALTPCQAGQERNPETNRCRSVLASASSLSPCKAGQERNPETNRCRSIAASESNLTPCAEGQERNPDTNRCRKAVLSANTTKGIAKVSDVASTTSGTGIRWWLAGAGAAAALGYAMYEWRRDLANLWHRRHASKLNK